METKKSKEPEKKRPNEVLKYSGMGTKMAITILLGIYVGKYLDEKMALNTPWWTLALSIISVAVAIVIVIRDTTR